MRPTRTVFVGLARPATHLLPAVGILLFTLSVWYSTIKGVLTGSPALHRQKREQVRDDIAHRVTVARGN
jgi:hypothetical protein